MISINVSSLAIIKLEDKCEFHFSIMRLLSEERIIFKSLILKKDVLHVLLLLSQDTKSSEIAAITSGVLLKHSFILIFKLIRLLS